MSTLLTLNAEGIWTARVRANGALSTLALGADKPRARQLLAKIRSWPSCSPEALNARLEQELALPCAPLHVCFSTLDEFGEAYAMIAPQLGVCREVARRTHTDLFRLVEIARTGQPLHPHRRGKVRLTAFDDFPEVWSLPLTCLTPALVEAYRAVFRNGRAPGAFEVADASVHALLRRVCCMFIPAAIDLYRKLTNVVIPDLRPFLRAALVGSLYKHRDQPSDDTIVAAHAAVADLRSICCVLALRAGLTRAELLNLKSADFVDGHLRLRAGGRFERIITPEPVVTRFLAAMPPDQRIGGIDTLAQASAALQARGLDGLPALRDCYVRYVLTRYSAVALFDKLGIRSIRNFPTWDPLPPSLVALWNQPLNTP